MCRFLHQIDGPERCSASTGSFNGNLEVESSGSEDGYGSYAHHFGFESFEMELRELLKGRKTPVSIASLPQMYYERFGKSLQADGYLTESQRHGKAGFSLTRLLMKLKGTVRLIERCSLDPWGCFYLHSYLPLQTRVCFVCDIAFLRVFVLFFCFFRFACISGLMGNML
jgi:hypothetical protein